MDLTKSKLYIQQMGASSTSVKALFTNLSDQINVDTEQLIKAVLEGKLVIVSKEKEENAVVDPVAQNFSSSIAEPKNESPLQASMDAFGDDINITVGMIRKRLICPICNSTNGRYSGITKIGNEQTFL